MVEVVDQELTKTWFDFISAFPELRKGATPCTYLECEWCGFNYECRTVGIKLRTDGGV